jgi:hypothetical protein
MSAMSFDDEWAALVEDAAAKRDAYLAHMREHFHEGASITTELWEESDRLEDEWRAAEELVHSFAHRNWRQFTGWQPR